MWVGIRMVSMLRAGMVCWCDRRRPEARSTRWPALPTPGRSPAGTARWTPSPRPASCRRQAVGADGRLTRCTAAVSCLSGSAVAASADAAGRFVRQALDSARWMPLLKPPSSVRPRHRCRAAPRSSRPPLAMSLTWSQLLRSDLGRRQFCPGLEGASIDRRHGGQRGCVTAIGRLQLVPRSARMVEAPWPGRHRRSDRVLSRRSGYGRAAAPPGWPTGPAASGRRSASPEARPERPLNGGLSRCRAPVPVACPAPTAVETARPGRGSVWFRPAARRR